MKEKYNLPGTRYKESDDTTLPFVSIDSIAVGYAGCFERGEIGVPIYIDQENDVVDKLGNGRASAIINNWHIVRKMAENSSVVVSRALHLYDSGSEIEHTASAYGNIYARDSVERTIIEITKATKIDESEVTALTVDAKAVDIVSQKLDGTLLTIELEYSVKPDFSEPLMVTIDGGTVSYTIEDYLTVPQIFTYDFTYNINPDYPLSNISVDYFIELSLGTLGDANNYESAGGSGTPHEMTIIENTQVSPKRYVLSFQTLVEIPDLTTPMTVNFMELGAGNSVIDLDSGGGTVPATFVAVSKTQTNLSEISFPTDFTSIGLYGTAKNIYDKNYKFFEPTGIKNILYIAQTPGTWGNGITVSTYGYTTVNADAELLALVDFQDLLSNEALIIVTSDFKREQFIVSFDKLTKNDEGELYYFQDVLRKKSTLIHGFLPSGHTEDTEGIRSSVTLSRGLDGVISAQDVANAYGLYNDSNITTPLLVTGNGTFTTSDITLINNVVDIICDEVKDRLVLKTVPISLIKTVDPHESLITWLGEGGWKTSSKLQKNVTYSTYFTIKNYYGGKDIVVPSGVLLASNWTATAKNYGRQQAILSDLTGIIGGYEECLWHIIDENKAGLLHKKKINPIMAWGGNFISNGQETGLPKRTGLSKANQRWMFNYLAHNITMINKAHVALANTQDERDKLAGVVIDFLKDLLDNKHIAGYIVQCDENNNDDSDFNIFIKVKVVLIVTGEIINLELINTSAGNL